MTDNQLLRSFVREHSETAFGEIVARHLPLVYSTALRQTGEDSHLAKDVAQLVFTDFARKSPSFSENVILAGWLHRATIFASRQTMRGERRRQLREREAAFMNTTQPETEDADWRQIHSLLDEALDHMPLPTVMLKFMWNRMAISAHLNSATPFHLPLTASRICIAGIQIGRAHDLVRSADLEIGDTAGLETCATI